MANQNIIGVAQIVASNPVSPQSLNGVVPSEADLRTALTNDSDTWDQFILKYIRKSIDPKWFTNGSKIAFLMPKLLRKPDDLQGFSKTIAIDLPPTYVKRGEEIELITTWQKLEHKIFDEKINGGFEIFKEYLSLSPITTPQNLDEAVKKVIDLTRFEAFLVRVIGAENAANASGLDLASVLAQSRLEGNLSSPSSLHNLSEDIPPIDNLKDFNMGPPRPKFEHVIWTKSKNSYRNSINRNDDFKIVSLLDYFMIIAGFDTMQHYLETESDFATFSSGLWGRAGKDGSYVAAAKRYNDMLDNLHAEEINVNGRIILRSVPIDNLKFVSMLWTEAMMNTLAPINNVNFMKWMVYNAGESGFKNLSRSAMKAANRTTGEKYEELRDAIGSEKLSFPSLNSWFDNSTNRELLEGFISTAGKSVWKNWYESRSGLSKLIVIHDYYKALLG